MKKGGYYYIEFKSIFLNGKYKVIDVSRGPKLNTVYFLRSLKDDNDSTATEAGIKRFIELYYF